MNKSAIYAGSFYPENAEEITNLFNSYKQSDDSIEYKSKAIIVPHAGVWYSGHAAMAAYQCLDMNDNIFIIAPSHYEDFNNIALPKYTYFDTPLGSLEVNNRRIKEIAEKFPCVISDEIFDKEHSIEVQLPFIQHLFCGQITNALDFVKGLTHLGRKIRIIPILVGNCDYRLISDIISTYWEDSSFIISSDLSHYYAQSECKKIDTYTATIIETGKLECFQPQQACGLTGIMGLIDFANNNDCVLIRRMLYNSGDITNETDKVVGYGSWFLYPERRNDFIEKFHSKYVADIAKKAILSAIKGEEFIPNKIPPVLTQYGASFVTIKLNGELRGCVGSIFPTKPLILDIIDNAVNAGFNDTRFNPLTEREIPHLEVIVSILCSIERIPFKDERDLLGKIYPYGIIISERNLRAVYLPEVWEQLPNREVFLQSLKEKAGLRPNYFSKTFEAYKFMTTVISSHM
ncbi:MAG: AmmeMemoRadiSam system protein B [bacterium]|nr:AmmeMemoRadiSam system protein B [bacterium]